MRFFSPKSGHLPVAGAAELATNARMTRFVAPVLALLLPIQPLLAESPGFRLLASPGFESAGDGFAGVVPVRKDGLWGLLAADGTWAAEPAYQAVGEPGRGRLPVEKGDLWGVVDATGHMVTPFAFQAIGQIADWTPMRWKGQWWAVGPDGQPEGQPLPFDQLLGNDGTCMVGKAGGVPVAVNRGTTSGATMLKAEDEMRAPSEGFVPIAQDGREGHLDCAWGTIVGGEPAAMAVRGFHQGWAALKGPSGWGYGSVFGNTVEIGGSWTAAGDFAEGLAPVQVADLWGYVREDGSFAIPPRFDAAGDFQDGMAPAQVQGLWGFIGKSGDWLVTPQFQAVMAPSQGVAAVEQGGKWGVIAVSPLRIAGAGLFGPAGPLTALMRVLGPVPGCPSHILPPGTAIFSGPGIPPAQATDANTVLGVCLGTTENGFVQVLKGGHLLGWVDIKAPLALR
jgi:hypothetical protein